MAIVPMRDLDPHLNGEGASTLAVAGFADEPERTSGIEAPTMRLSGHNAELFTVQFSHDGKNVATAGMDRRILVYNVYGECQTWSVMSGHKNAILEVKWGADDTQIFSCGVDGSVCVWDVATGTRIKKLNGHVSSVNSISTFYPYQKGGIYANIYKRPDADQLNSSENNDDQSTKDIHPVYSFSYTHGKGSYSCTNTLVSAGDDGSARIWDLRDRKHVMKVEHPYQMLSVALDGYGGRVFCGSLDNTIRVYDIRSSMREIDILRGHVDSITGLDIHPTGSHLLSNSMDQTIRQWDIQPFSTNETRLLSCLKGSVHNFEKNLLRVRWSADGSYAAAGSSDRFVCVWDMNGPANESTMVGSLNMPLRPLVYRLPGHSGSVNDVSMHPLEPIIASASSDKTCFLGELA